MKKHIKKSFEDNIKEAAFTTGEVVGRSLILVPLKGPSGFIEAIVKSNSPNSARDLAKEKLKENQKKG